MSKTERETQDEQTNPDTGRSETVHPSHVSPEEGRKIWNDLYGKKEK